MCRPAGDEAAVDLARRVQLATGEGPRSGDGIARSIVRRRLRLEKREHPLSAIGRPACDEPAVGFGQRLRRYHASTLAPGDASWVDDAAVDR